MIFLQPYQIYKKINKQKKIEIPSKIETNTHPWYTPNLKDYLRNCPIQQCVTYGLLGKNKKVIKGNKAINKK